MMRQAATSLIVETRGQGFTDLTPDVSGWLEGTGITAGLLTVFCRHTSASLVIQENASPDVRRDLLGFFGAIAPEDADYDHADEGPDDMPAHIRTALTQTSIGIPVIGGRLAFGTWQALYLFEHRRRHHRREIVLHLMGE